MKWKHLALLVGGLVVAFFAGMAGAQFNVVNYMEQGGARLVIGGQIDVVSGGEIDVETGGALKIAGAAVTSSGAELNLVDGQTAGAFPPATCTPGQIFVDTDETVDTNCPTVADNALCYCITANNWSPNEP